MNLPMSFSISIYLSIYTLGGSRTRVPPPFRGSWDLYLRVWTVIILLTPIAIKRCRKKLYEREEDNEGDEEKHNKDNIMADGEIDYHFFVLFDSSIYNETPFAIFTRNDFAAEESCQWMKRKLNDNHRTVKKRFSGLPSEEPYSVYCKVEKGQFNLSIYQSIYLSGTRVMRSNSVRPSVWAVSCPISYNTVCALLGR